MEEQFGGSEYLLLMDRLSYVNVPMMMHLVLPSLPSTSVYAGCFMEKSMFGSCKQSNSTGWCSHFGHGRVPIFAHGMGFLVSADVARGVAHNAKRMELATRHLPPDVAYGVWVQPLEGIQYKHMVLFEEIPQEELFAALLFPMDWLLWQKLFQVDTCQLGTGRENLWFPDGCQDMF